MTKPRLRLPPAPRPLETAHACVTMLYTGAWASAADIAPVQGLLGREDVTTMIYMTVDARD